jgi:hypothetical protein
MLRKIGVILTVILLLLCGFSAVGFAAGDTGSYEITDYTCMLDPSPSGDVMLTLTQKWLVTGGHIPFVTVGLPNQYFNVVSFSGAAKSVRSDNNGNWYGVYVTLDRDYQPGSSFEFTFNVLQRYLMQNGQINYTPGWYDSAATDRLKITVLVPAGAGELTYYPTPTATDSSTVVWEKLNLKPGERLTIQVTFNGLVSSTYVPAGQPSGGSSDSSWLDLVIPVLIVGVGAIFTVLAIRQRKSQAALAGTPQKRKVVTLDKEGKVVKEEEEEYEKPSVRPVTTYRSSCYIRSCACVSCACVSCACACACAGGRGAGCAKKGFIDCDKCRRKEDCPERRVSAQ